jgi:pilus assembly protein CpaB
MERRSGSSAIFRPKQSQNRTIMLAVGGGCLVLGLAIVLLSGGESGKEQRDPTVIVQSAPEIELVDVLVPVRPIETGTEFMPDMFRVEQKPRVSLPSGTISRFEQIRGQFARDRIMTEIPMSDQQIMSVRPVTAISKKIPEGFRAVTIPVDQTTGVEGWAKPGVKVDISWTSNKSGESLVTTIVYNAEVLSAGGNPAANPNEPAGQVSTVTLLVSDSDASKIHLAQTAGKLSLSLRGDTDSTGPRGPGGVLTLDDLLGRSVKSIPAVRKRLGCVKVRRPEGGYDEMCLGDEGNLEPVE